MRTYGKSLLVVVIVIAGLLTVPTTREVIRVEGSAFCPFASLHDLYFVGELATERPSGLDFDQLAAQARAENPKNWKTVMGAGLLAEDEQKKLAYLEEAVELAPDEPAALVALAEAQTKGLKWRRETSYHYAQRDVPSDFKEELLTAEEARSAGEILERWKQIDPDNAAPEVLLAWLDFGEKRDTEALVNLKAAIAQPRWDFHEGTLLQAKLHVLTDAGIPEFEAARLCSTRKGPFAFHARLREVARTATSKGQEAREAGRHEEAVEDWMATISFGRLMRYEGDTLIESLVGNAIESIGASPIYRWARVEVVERQGLKPASELVTREGRYSGGDMFEGKHLNYFVQHAGAAAAANVLAGVEQVQQLRSHVREHYKEDVLSLTARRAMVLMQPGATMLAGMIILLVLAIVAGIVFRGKAPGFDRLRIRWRILLSIIALAPIIGFWIFQSLREIFYTEFAEPIAPVIIPVTRENLFYMLILLLALVLITTVWFRLRRATTHISFWKTYGRLLHQILPVCIVLLTLLYGGATIQTARPRTKSVSLMKERMAHGDMVKLRRDHPQFFTAPALVEPE